MKKISFKFLAFVFLIAAIGACSVDDGDNYCATSQYMAVSTVTGAVTTKINVPITFNVNVMVASSCGTFNRFVETTAYPKTITALVDYVGCTCDQKSSLSAQTYTFQAAAPGEYVLKFSTEDANAPITKTITVTAE